MSWTSPREAWEERYSSTAEYVYGTDPNTFLVGSVAGLSPGRALCLAEGEGRNAVYLAEQGYSVTSVELTSAGVEKTLALAEARGVSVDAHQGDLASFELGTSAYDLVVSIFAHCDEATRIGLHRRVVDALAPGGLLVLEAYTPAQIGRGTGGPQEASLTMDLARLTVELEGLTFLHAAELVRPVIEGPLHTGDGAVVQVVAEKP